MLPFPTSSPSSLRRFITISFMYPHFNAFGPRNTWRRGFSQGRVSGGEPLVSGDSHHDAVRDANYGHRWEYRGNYQIPRGNNWQEFRPQPPPSQGFHRPNYQRDDHRKWVYAVAQPPPQCELFTVLSYNILADYLAKDHRSKLYFHIPHHILDWEWRKKRLFLEFGLWAPDIMCLQEVDKFHDLEEELAIRGYTGIWKMRTGNAVDGCAIFWRTNRFHLRHEEHIEFYKLGLRDNVAQICVLESRTQNPGDHPYTSSSSSSSPPNGVNQVVVCNIHVLYNPKRGEMKLAQVRLLLERAYAVSSIWNDAPVIVCGDFNSTPQSPMYKFITEQKLSLSGLARNQISGQYVASKDSFQPYFGSGQYRPQHFNDNSIERKDAEFGNSFTSIENNLKPQTDSESASQKEQIVHSIHSTLSGSLQSNEGVHGELIISISMDTSSDHELSEEQKAVLGGENSVPKSETQTSVVPSMHECLTGHGILNDYVDASQAPFAERSESNTCDEPSPGNTEVSTPENSQPLPSLAHTGEIYGDTSWRQNSSTCTSSLNEFDKKLVRALDSNEDCQRNNSADMLPYTDEHVTVNTVDHYISMNSNLEESDEVFKNSSSGCNPEENPDPNFLIELIGNDDAPHFVESFGQNNFSFSPGNKATNAEASYSSADLHKSELNSPTAEVSSHLVGSPPVDMERHLYNPYSWTPMEIAVASGYAGCTLVEHSLKLRSAYADVEDHSGTKDSSREPEVTSYNRLFMGTVDYIWYSEGLQTVKVLDTIPKQVLKKTPGFPTHRWGSDHLALACQFAFTKGVRTTK